MDKEFKAKADLFFSVLSQGKFGSIKVYYEGKKIFYDTFALIKCGPILLFKTVTSLSLSGCTTVPIRR